MNSLKVRYIQNGATIGANYAGFIAVSADGTNWDFISGAGLTVGKYYRSINTLNAKNSHPESGSESGWVIVVKNGETPVLRFDHNKVLNQAGWIGGVTEAQVAVANITAWI